MPMATFRRAYVHGGVSAVAGLQELCRYAECLTACRDNLGFELHRAWVYVEDGGNVPGVGVVHDGFGVDVGRVLDGDGQDALLEGMAVPSYPLPGWLSSVGLRIRRRARLSF